MRKESEPQSKVLQDAIELVVDDPLASKETSRMFVDQKYFPKTSRAMVKYLRTGFFQ